MSSRFSSKPSARVARHKQPATDDQHAFSEEQLTLFSCLDNRCIDCEHFYRYRPFRDERLPDHWYRRNTGGCEVKRHKTLTYESCDAFEAAVLNYDDREFMQNLTMDDFDDPLVQKYLDEIAERNNR